MEHARQEMKRKKEAKNEDLRARLHEALSLKPRSAFFLTLLTGLSFTMKGLWQLVVIAGLLGGFFIKRGREALKVGFVGIFSAWMILFIGQALFAETLSFFTFWMVETMGLPIELILLGMALSSLIGGCFGALGALNGVYLGRIVIDKVRSPNKSRDPT